MTSRQDRTTSSSGLPASMTAKVCGPRSKASCSSRTAGVASDTSPVRAAIRCRIVSTGASSQMPANAAPCPRRNLGDFVALLLLGVDRVDDDGVPALERHQGALAAHGVDDVRDLRGIGRPRQPLFRADAEQSLAFDIAPHMHRTRKDAEMRRKRLRHARLAASRQSADGDELRPLPFKIVARKQNIGGGAAARLFSRHADPGSRATARPWP